MIIGTAGHIDHGKTTLIKALTGVETDRLIEERKRGISIDLGFAEFKLPSGIVAGVVDVPGHERFIKNMLAGATGIDLVLLVIASDDGIMPQTEEHLSIIDLLGVGKIVVALSKTDLVEKDWLGLVADDVKELLEKKGYLDVPIIPVSPISGEGIDELLSVIDKIAQEVKEKDLDSPFRLPIDRVFTIAGAGTIITGTLWEGQIKTGSNVEIRPGKKVAKVRSVQVHNKTVELAKAGQRVALNLTGVEKEELSRGNTIVQSGYLAESKLIDVKLLLLEEWKRNLKNRERIRFHHGTLEVMGRVVLLDRRELEPGDSCYARIYLEKEVLPKYRDKFVIRSYSPLFTIGGGNILNSHPLRRRKSSEILLNELGRFDKGKPYDVVMIKMTEFEDEPLTLTEIVRRTELKEEDVNENLEKLVKDGKVINLENNYYFDKKIYQDIKEQAEELLKDFHKREPLSKGMNKETFKAKLFSNHESARSELLLSQMVSDGQIKLSGETVFSPEYKAELSQDDQTNIKKITKLLSAKPFSPPDLNNLSASLGVDAKKTFSYLQILKEQNKVVQIKGDMFFDQKAFAQAKQTLTNFIKKNGDITPAEFRDELKTTRKYIVPLLEYFDSIKVTLRKGDKRILR